MSPQISVTRLLNAATTTSTGSAKKAISPYRSYQASGATSSGAGAATIKIEVSNDESNWLELGEIVLTLSTTTSSDGFANTDGWKFVRARVSAISGTGASVTVDMGA